MRVDVLIVLFGSFVLAIVVVVFVYFLSFMVFVVFMMLVILVMFVMFVVFMSLTVVFVVLVMLMRFPIVFVVFMVFVVFVVLLVGVLFTPDLLLLFILCLVEHVFLELFNVALDDVFFWQLFLFEPDLLFVFLNLVSPLDLVLQQSELLLNLTLDPQGIVSLSQIRLLFSFLHWNVLSLFPVLPLSLFYVSIGQDVYS